MRPDFQYESTGNPQKRIYEEKITYCSIWLIKSKGSNPHKAKHFLLKLPTLHIAVIEHCTHALSYREMLMINAINQI